MLEVALMVEWENVSFLFLSSSFRVFLIHFVFLGGKLVRFLAYMFVGQIV